MGATNVEPLSPAEGDRFAAVVERMRQLRRRAGVPDGVTAAEAVALHMVGAEEPERTRWGDPGAPPMVAMQAGSDGVA